jgi:hypothetical protein
LTALRVVRVRSSGVLFRQLSTIGSPKAADSAAFFVL